MLLAKFVAVSNVPNRIVDIPEFKNFIANLNPAYIVPSRGKIQGLINDIFDQTMDKIKFAIQNTSYISLSCDFWSIDRMGIYGVSASLYFANSSTKKCVLLCLKYVKAPHTSEFNLQETLEILNQFGINGLTDKRLVSISTDNGSNMKKAFAMTCENFDDSYG